MRNANERIEWDICYATLHKYPSCSAFCPMQVLEGPRQRFRQFILDIFPIFVDAVSTHSELLFNNGRFGIHLCLLLTYCLHMR